MIVEIQVPSPGESISEVEIASWLVGDGDYVEKDQEIAEIESDKATLPLIAEKAGKIRLLAAEGDTVEVGRIVCSIDTSAGAPAAKKKAVQADRGKAAAAGERETGKPGSEPAGSGAIETVGGTTPGESSAYGPELAKTAKRSEKTISMPSSPDSDKVRVSPVAAKMMEDNGLSLEDIVEGLPRIGKKEVQKVLDRTGTSQVQERREVASREENRQKMSRLRRKLGERLVSVKNETAMLTTFNECDMSEVIRLRKKYQSTFVEVHGVKLGFMSFFVKAVTEALRLFPNVNARIEGDEMVMPEFCDIGIAVQTDKGLMVPVIRNAEAMGLAEIEKVILDLAEKARTARINLEEMSGGTFTITNGGVFGSMLSTPILNPPQSAILGMHNIQDRPVAVDERVEIRPMMYIALSYDHRLIDGRDSVSFLVKVRELIQNPVNLLFRGSDPDKLLLGL